MARYAPITHPAVAGGSARSSQARKAFGRVTAVGALLFLFAAVGSVAVGAAAAVRQDLADWAEARRQRDEDRKMWDLALSDSRVMADLIAIRQDAGSSRF